MQDNIVFSFRGLLGVRVDVGQTIMGLVLLIVLLSGARGDLIGGLIFVAMLVLAIYLHELGHAWGYRVQGLGVNRILIYGGGGLCFGARAGTPYQQELVVAMGPLVNLALWALSGVGQWVLYSWVSGAIATGQSPSIAVIQATQYAYIYLGMFGMINLFLALFNLVPVQPLDGGKLLHLILLRFMQPKAAYRLTGQIGVVGCILWVPFLVFLYYYANWILFFMPSLALHRAMAQGRGVV